jgi:isoleucyl-tRNA synthetase
MLGRKPGEKLSSPTRWPRSAFATRLELECTSACAMSRPTSWPTLTCAHPLQGSRRRLWDFDVPLLAGDHVTDDAGTGFVHTAPGHGARTSRSGWCRELEARGMTHPRSPSTTTASSTKDAAGLLRRRADHHDDKGKKGNANKAVIEALIEAGKLLARGRLKHSYPHSWRSKKPVIFRNTPQWFVYMDMDLGDGKDTLRRTIRAERRSTIDPLR